MPKRKKKEQQQKPEENKDKKEENKEETPEEKPLPTKVDFIRKKHRLIPTRALMESDEEITKEFSIVDDVEYNRMGEKKARNEYLKLVKVGRARMVKVHRVNSEIVEIREEKGDDIKVVKQYFTHVPPIRDYDQDGNEKLVHFAYEDEPFTRDWFTMRPIDDQKKWNKLLEIGCVVRHDDLDNLIRYFSIISEQPDPETGKHKVFYGVKEIQEEMYLKSPTGFFFKPEWAGFDMYGKPRQVYDISDIDAIKEEMYKVNETELIKGYSEAVMADPYAKSNRATEFIVIVMSLAIILVAAVIVIWT